MKSNRQIFKLSIFGVLAFLFLAVLFSAFNYHISNLNRFFLSMTGEISVKEIKTTETAAELSKDKKRIEELKKIKIPATPKKTTGKAAAKPAVEQVKHRGRTEPARKGFYVEDAEKITDQTSLHLFRKEQVVYNQEDWTGKGDTSATCIVVKGKSGITVNVNVVDDELIAESGTPWMNDCVEFYFDIRPEERRAKDIYEKGVFQVITVPYFSKTIADKPNFYAGGSTPIEIKGTKVKSVKTQKGYKLQIFFPYEGLKAAHFMPDKDFNFDFSVIDVDSSGKKKQMIWSGTADNCRGPAWFGNLSPAPEDAPK
ncbi:MAG: hypothetical protein A2017_19235 [Lentisphaerae bacterium GWF2_44_16]|nr:MAG: hypothetical protein A2017_19235 [Lentisphaerae bacterium GWF2_44_16]